MVYTNEMLVFARLGNDELADIVPLKEILSVTGTTEKQLDIDPFNSFKGSFADKGGDDAVCMLEINTSPDGYNSGRVFKIRVVSKMDQEAIIEDLTRFSTREREKTIIRSKYKKTQDRIAAVINSNMVQMFLAFLITMVRIHEIRFIAYCESWRMILFLIQNFVVNIFETKDDSSRWGQLFARLNIVFTLIFTAELFVNMAAHWLSAFFSSW